MKLVSRFLVLALALLLVLSGSLAASAEVSKAAVKAVQQALNDLGYDCGNPDGIAGKNTEKAVSAYQSANGMSADGKITDALLDALGIDGSGVKKTVIKIDPSEDYSERDPEYDSPVFTLIDNDSVCVKAWHFYNSSGDFVHSWPVSIENKTGQELRVGRAFSLLNGYSVDLNMYDISVPAHQTITGEFGWNPSDIDHNGIMAVTSTEFTMTFFTVDEDYREELLMTERLALAFAPAVPVEKYGDVKPAADPSEGGIVLVDDDTLFVELTGIALGGDDPSLDLAPGCSFAMSVYVENRSERYLYVGLNSTPWDSPLIVNGYSRGSCSTSFELAPGGRINRFMSFPSVADMDLPGYRIEKLEDIREIEGCLFFSAGDDAATYKEWRDDLKVVNYHVFPQGKDAALPRETTLPENAYVVRDTKDYKIALIAVDADARSRYSASDETSYYDLTLYVENKGNHLLELWIDGFIVNGVDLSDELGFRSIGIAPGAVAYSICYLWWKDLNENGITEISSLDATVMPIDRDTSTELEEAVPVSLLTPEVLAALSTPGSEAP